MYQPCMAAQPNQGHADMSNGCICCAHICTATHNRRHICLIHYVLHMQRCICMQPAMVPPQLFFFVRLFHRQNAPPHALPILPNLASLFCPFPSKKCPPHHLFFLGPGGGWLPAYPLGRGAVIFASTCLGPFPLFSLSFFPPLPLRFLTTILGAGAGVRGSSRNVTTVRQQQLNERAKRRARPSMALFC